MAVSQTSISSHPSSKARISAASNSIWSGASLPSSFLRSSSINPFRGIAGREFSPKTRRLQKKSASFLWEEEGRRSGVGGYLVWKGGFFLFRNDSPYWIFYLLYPNGTYQQPSCHDSAPSVKPLILRLIL